MMKVNTKNNDWSFAKRFTKRAFNSAKINFDIKSDMFSKNFFFSAYLLFFKKSACNFGILYLHGHQFYLVQCFSRNNTQFLNFILGENYFE